MALIPIEGEIQKAPYIQSATCHCISLSSLRGYDNGTLL